jgi:hypothetical protein
MVSKTAASESFANVSEHSLLIIVYSAYKLVISGYEKVTAV